MSTRRRRRFSRDAPPPHVTGFTVIGYGSDHHKKKHVSSYGDAQRTAIRMLRTGRFELVRLRAHWSSGRVSNHESWNVGPRGGFQLASAARSVSRRRDLSHAEAKTLLVIDVEGRVPQMYGFVTAADALLRHGYVTHHAFASRAPWRLTAKGRAALAEARRIVGVSIERHEEERRNVHRYGRDRSRKTSTRRPRARRSTRSRV